MIPIEISYTHRLTIMILLCMAQTFIAFYYNEVPRMLLAFGSASVVMLMVILEEIVNNNDDDYTKKPTSAIAFYVGGCILFLMFFLTVVTSLEDIRLIAFLLGTSFNLLFFVVYHLRYFR